MKEGVSLIPQSHFKWAHDRFTFFVVVRFQFIRAEHPNHHDTIKNHKTFITLIIILCMNQHICVNNLGKRKLPRWKLKLTKMAQTSQLEYYITSGCSCPCQVNIQEYKSLCFLQAYHLSKWDFWWLNWTWLTVKLKCTAKKLQKNHWPMTQQGHTDSLWHFLQSEIYFTLPQNLAVSLIISLSRQFRRQLSTRSEFYQKQLPCCVDILTTAHSCRKTRHCQAIELFR